MRQALDNRSMQMRATRTSGAPCVALLLVMVAAADANADRYELTLSLRPTAVLGQLDDEVGPLGSSVSATTYGAGATFSAGYGMRNWLDIGAEVFAVQFANAEYPDASVAIGGSPRTGLVTRAMRSGQLRLGATFRFGVRWIPTLYLGVGLGGSMRGAATFATPVDGRPMRFEPDGLDADTTVYLAPMMRVGLDHRLNRSLTIGVAVGASQWIGLGFPTARAVEVALAISHSWYQ